MEWIVVGILGAIMGSIVSFVVSGSRMPQSLAVILGMVGAIAGASLDRITGFNALGSWTFYASGAVVAIGFLAGGTLGYSLTSTEDRV